MSVESSNLYNEAQHLVVFLMNNFLMYSPQDRLGRRLKTALLRRSKPNDWRRLTFLAREVALKYDYQYGKICLANEHGYYGGD